MKEPKPIGKDLMDTFLCIEDYIFMHLSIQLKLQKGKKYNYTKFSSDIQGVSVYFNLYDMNTGWFITRIDGEDLCYKHFKDIKVLRDEKINDILYEN